jgi:hypothetical protein
MTYDNSYVLEARKFDNFSLFQSSKSSPSLMASGECVEIYPQHALICLDICTCISSLETVNGTTH